MNSFSLAGGEDNKWLNLQRTSEDGNNEWGVFINFILCDVVSKKQL